MTVSRTINGHPYVANETAKKVRAAIRELDYRPNHAARVLTGQLSKAIGLIVPDLSDPFFSIVSHAVQEAAREAGYLAWLAASNGDPAIEEAQIEQMTHHPVDGILLVPASSQSKYLKAVAAGSTPLVTIDRPIEAVVTDSVEVENRAGARMAVEHLIGHGYKKITCMVMNFHLQPVKQRVAGYEECMRHANLSRRKITLSDEVTAQKVLSALFDSADRPEALFTANNACTICVIKTLRILGIEVPRDVALVGFDDVDFYTLLNPPVTTIRQPAAELGRTSTRLLLQKIRSTSSASIARTVLPVTLMIRQSCGCNEA
jgi:Transcriptional regulators